MTRSKVTLSFIANDASRKATFKKRKKGLLSKVHELSTLCGVEACAVIFSPYEPEPEVWPDMRGCQRVMARFKGMRIVAQGKKMVNQASFVRDRLTKAADQLKKMQRENREAEITHLMYQCLMGRGLHGLGVAELNDMGWLLDKKLKEVDRMIEALEREKKAEDGGKQNQNGDTAMETRDGV